MDVAPTQTEGSGLAPHPEADQRSEPYITEAQRRRRDGPRFQVIQWAPHQAWNGSPDIERMLRYERRGHGLSVPHWD